MGNTKKPARPKMVWRQYIADTMFGYYRSVTDKDGRHALEFRGKRKDIGATVKWWEGSGGCWRWSTTTTDGARWKNNGRRTSRGMTKTLAKAQERCEKIITEAIVNNTAAI